MRMVCIRGLLSAVFLAGVCQQASAQMAPAQDSVGVAVGMVNFDVDGVATTPGLSGRVSVAPSPRVAVEANLSWARNNETGTSDMWVAEAHLQYFWLAANRVRPFAGGGAGLYINQGEFLTDRSLTLSAAAGLRIDLTDRLAALGEFRIRGVEVDFAGSLVEVWTGLTVRLGN